MVYVHYFHLKSTNTMKFLKIFLGTIILLIAIPFILALFTAKGYAVEREVNIQKSNVTVFDYVKHLKKPTKFLQMGQLRSKPRNII